MTLRELFPSADKEIADPGILCARHYSPHPGQRIVDPEMGFDAAYCSACRKASSPQSAMVSQAT
jgi:hypothetical protein